MGLIKLAIGAVVIGGLFYLYKAGKLVNSFGATITGYGTPGVSGTNIDLPVNVQFVNPTPLAINIDNVNAQIYLQKGGSWVNVATINQPLSIPSGTTVQKFTPRIDLSKLFGGNLLDTLSLASSVLQQQILSVRTDLTATYAGVTTPSQSFIQNIQVG